MSQPSKEFLEKYAEYQLETIKPELQLLAQSTFSIFSNDSSKSAIQESQDLHQKIESVNLQLSEIQRSLNLQANGSKCKNSQYMSSSSVLSPTIKALKELQESTIMLIQKGKKCFPKEKISEDCKLKINRFYCKIGENGETGWVLNVANDTEDYFRKIEFYILEAEQKIAEIKLIEPKIDIKKHIGHLNIQEIYGKHLIAKVDNRPVSELFPIMKIEFKSAKDSGEDENGNSVVQLTILNSFPKPIDNLYVFCNETCQRYYIEEELDSGETYDVDIPYGDLESISLRVMRENEVMSIAYSLNLGGEEEEEEVNADPVPIGNRGLAMSNPFPIAPSDFNPLAQKVNEQLSRLDESQRNLAEVIKRNYPGIETKMQLFKAVSRYDNYDECIDYLIDAKAFE